MIAKEVEVDLIKVYGNFSEFVQEASVKIAYHNLNSTLITDDIKTELIEFLKTNFDIENILRKELIKHKSCWISNHLLTDTPLKIYFTGNNSQIHKSNVYDFIKVIKSSIEAYIENPHDMENFEFFINTTILLALPQIEKFFYDIIDCSNSEVDTLNTINYIILIIQVSLLIASFILKFSEVLKIIQNFNKIWNTIGENVHKYFYQLRDKCINRLTDNLSIKEDEIFHLYDYTAVGKPCFSLNFTQLIGQIWIVILFVIVSLVYFFIVSQISYINIGEQVKNVNCFNHLLYKQKSYIYQADFWTIFGLSNQIFKDTQKEFIAQIWEKYNENTQAIESKSFSSSVANEIYNSLFKSNDENTAKYGVVHEAEAAFYDSLHMFETQNFIEIAKYRNKMQDVRIILELDIQKTFIHGKAINREEINKVIVLSALYTVFAFSMFFMVYLPFLIRQQNYFKHLEILAKIFVN